MSIEKMSLVNLAGSLSSLDTVLLRCCESELFHIEYALSSNGTNGFHQINEENPYTDLMQNAQQLMGRLELNPEYVDYQSLTLSDQQIQEYLEEQRLQVQELKTKIHDVLGNLTVHRQTKDQLEHMKGLDIRMDDLLRSQHYTVRFGRLPVDSYLKLEYFQKRNFFFFDFDHDDDYFWGVYFAPHSNEEEIDEIFRSLYFEIIEIPEDAHDTPQKAIDHFERLIAEEEKQLASYESQLEQYRTEHKNLLFQIYSYLKVHHDTFAYRKYATVAKNQFYLEGFVPSKKVKAFFKLFDDLDNVLCEEQPADADSRFTPPVQLKTNWFFKPFEMYVKMYGLPNYHDINPTSFIGVIYVLLFGIMFGDLGQGFLLVIGGLLFWKWKKSQLGAIVSRCGISSMIFGTAYGSVFGFEHLLDPMFRLFGFAEKPIDVFESQTTNTILIAVVGIGAIVLICSILINIMLGFRHKDYERAVFSNNGLAGLVFYVGVVAAVALMFTAGINVFNPIFILVIIVLPLALMFFREPLSRWAAKKKDWKPEGGIGSFIMQNFFELFEFCLSFITNTLSFLRVGGFVLSHAGMMAIVMSLSEMVGGVGSPIVIVFGNLFVMVLEGLLVGIQSLRLTFYETFSRFYDGDGKPFQPVKVNFSDSQED
ncbi:MAG: V-type ATP synthase subunit I [Massiliimalia sp.]|jgi:V/A-type H+-transporting ATPase subunit I